MYATFLNIIPTCFNVLKVRFINFRSACSIAENYCLAAGAGTTDSATSPITWKLLIHLIVVFIYDAIITTADEIRCFWGRKLTGAAVLFWLNKYVGMFFFVWSLAGFFSMSDKVRVERSRFTIQTADCL